MDNTFLANAARYEMVKRHAAGDSVTCDNCGGEMPAKSTENMLPWDSRRRIIHKKTLYQCLDCGNWCIVTVCLAPDGTAVPDCDGALLKWEYAEKKYGLPHEEYEVAIVVDDRKEN